MPHARHALLAYTVLTLAATWPLPLAMTRDVPGDLGDPLLSIWTLAWNGEQLLAVLSGDWSRIGAYFDANIFYPSPLALAYSEHLFAQAVQVLPIYALTRNPILCYNLLFLSTFVLSAWAMYLFVRELTGSAAAGFVAGLLFAFAPYRMPQSSHLQVLSSQWMPLALYAFRRYFDHGQLRALVGAAAALVLQALSSGYYLLYFFPFAAAYVLWEISRRGLWRQRRTWTRLTFCAAGVFACVAPFLLPYAAVRDAFGWRRPLGEVVRYSADVYSYATASSEQPLWGATAQAFPKPEGHLFPGFSALMLALLGLFAWRRERSVTSERVPRAVPLLIWLVVALHLAALLAVLLERRVNIDVGLFRVRITNADQMLFRAAVAYVAVMAASPRTRLASAAFMRGPGFFLACLAAAAWLSLGPIPQALGRPLDLFAPYRVLYDHVPGFDVVRMPARFGMVVTLMLAVLGGYGACILARVRRTQPVLAAFAVAALAEGLIVPLGVNGTTPKPDFNTPEPRVYAPKHAPPIYKEVARQPRDAVIGELPIGYADLDVRAMFYSTSHWRRLLNGYGGFFPSHYGPLVVALSDIPQHPAVAWQALSSSGATHVLVHEAAYLHDRGRATTAALRDLGAIELFRDGPDVLLLLPSR